jgi:3-isopropylmalate/(R)-2-methylmalate dehydratase small subunit
MNFEGNMNKNIRGKAFVYGANIDTDQIYPGRFLDLTDERDIVLHAMEGLDSNFIKNFTHGDIIVASTNFGCGSSREHAAIALKASGVGAIVAKSFARIFYRNAINLGIPLIVCPKFAIKHGDFISIDLDSSILDNTVEKTKYVFEPLSSYAMKILEAGGIKELLINNLNILNISI